MTVTDAHVVLLATGGTISSRSSQAGGAVASDTGEQVLNALGSHVSHPVRVLDVFQKGSYLLEHIQHPDGVGDVFQKVGALLEHIQHPVRVLDVFQKGSYLLTFDDMLRICATIKEVLKDPKVLGVVVTHGTDTMEETAFLTDLTHSDDRPVVFTGAQRAADSEAPDGPDNLARAIAVAGSKDARGRGVMVQFAGSVFPAAGVRKSQTLRLNAFANPDFGALGQVSAQGEVALAGNGRRPLPLPLPQLGGGSPRVDLVAAYPGADSTLMHAALEAGAEGIVLQGTGSGNANTSICAEVAAAVASGVVVVTSTRVDAGPVVPIYGAGGGGEDLRVAGAISSGHLRPSQSLILLSLLLRTNPDRERITEIFAQRGRPPEPSA